MNLKNVVIEGIDHSDAPDFVDAYISYAEWDSGVQLSEVELDNLNDNHPDVVYDHVINHLY